MKNVRASQKMSLIWVGFFSVWLILLTGLLDFWLKTPGLKQWYKVQATLSHRRQDIAAVEAKTERMKETSKQLESNAVAQEREIRRVLGYLGEHEVVFEFPN